MEGNIDHEYTDEIVCPHCGEEYQDSWEEQDNGNHTCYECGGEFMHERIVTVEYSTSTLPN